MQIKILDGQSSVLFSTEPFEKRPGMTIEDFGLPPMTILSLIFSGMGCTVPGVLSFFFGGEHPT